MMRMIGYTTIKLSQLSTARPIIVLDDQTGHFKTMQSTNIKTKLATNVHISQIQCCYSQLA